MRALTARRRIRFAGLGALSLLIGGTGSACTQRAVPVVAIDGQAIGTTWSLRVVDVEGDADADALRGIVEEALERVDIAASTWRDDSEVTAARTLAPGETLEISADLVAILDVASDVHDASGGAFDPTVGPLVAAYGFGAGASETEPTDEALARAAAKLGFDAFSWSGAALLRSRDDVSLDLSGVAKGYAVDLAAEALLAAGEARFMLEIGGEIRVAGTRVTGTPWVLGIYEPTAGFTIHGTIEASDVAVATSGDYRAFRELADGTRLSHTIDPRARAATQSGVASVTVIGRTCARADALATAIMVLGAEEGLTLVESLPEVEAYVLVHASNESGEDFEPRASSGFPELAPPPR